MANFKRVMHRGRHLERRNREMQSDTASWAYPLLLILLMILILHLKGKDQEQELLGLHGSPQLCFHRQRLLRYFHHL